MYRQKEKLRQKRNYINQTQKEYREKRREMTGQEQEQIEEEEAEKERIKGQSDKEQMEEEQRGNE